MFIMIVMSKFHENKKHLLDQLGLHHLRALDAILEAGHITRASEKLGISQSALSHQLARLREVMDDPLVVRSRRGVVPTPRAEALAEPLRRALAELEHVMTPAEEWEPSTAQRRFRLSLPEHFIPMILEKILPVLEDEAPGIELDVRSFPGLQIAKALEDGEVDLVGTSMSLATETLRSRPLFTSDLACAVRKKHPLVGKVMDLDTYCQLSHVLISPRGDASGIVDKHLAKLGRKRYIQITTAYFMTAPLLITCSDLILTGPRQMLQFMAKREPLRVLEIPKELAIPTFELGLLWHERVHKDPGHQWLRKLLSQAI